MSSTYFDTHLIATADLTSPPENLAGAILFGAYSAHGQSVFKAAAPTGRWYTAGALTCLVGADDSRFPKSQVIDLHLPESELMPRLRAAGAGNPNKPSPEWWPLLHSVSQEKRLMRIEMPPGTAAAKGVRVLAIQFPNTRFMLDVFNHGLVPGWQAQVRLAECDNVWLTTAGMFAGSWPLESLLNALHFVSGEVGAGKLLFASGAPLNLNQTDPAAWLEAAGALDSAQRELVLCQNAMDLMV